MTGDGLVNLGDRDAWLAQAGEINLGPGRVFLVGDATLDGFVDVQDFNEWNANRFTMGAAWCRGDFNADGVVDVQDFNIWNSNKFQTSDRAIPSLWPTTRRDPQPMARTQLVQTDESGLSGATDMATPLAPWAGAAKRVDAVFATRRRSDDPLDVAPKVVPLEKLSPTSSSFPWVTR